MTHDCLSPCVKPHFRAEGTRLSFCQDTVNIANFARPQA